jgi:predicted unusual protein kinase regulating ubiquinone biosynthesis (AarF/ABC1/UbiB family)
MWILWVMYREHRRMVRMQSSGSNQVQSSGDRLVRVASVLQAAAVTKQEVVLIKLGQFLSTRVDLLPERAIAILRTLQDALPPAPFDQIRDVVESELGQPIADVFSVLDHACWASASLGQVHQAVLASTGETVAVKVQRPQIEPLVKVDLRALQTVIWIITRVVGRRNIIDLMGFYREFAGTLYEELDYVREAANARRFRAIFKDDPTIYIPWVYDQYVSRRLLVLEWVEGIKIDDYATLDAVGINRHELVRRTVDAYFYQFFEVGFFHADPHPANLLVTIGQDGDDPVVIMVDFGMVGSYTPQMRHFMKQAFLAILARDTPALVQALTRLGFVTPGADQVSLEQALSWLLESYAGTRLRTVHDEWLASLMQDIRQLLYTQPLRIPPQFALTSRAVGLLLGDVTELDPEFDFFRIATPYARAFLGLERFGGIEQLAQQVLGQLVSTSTALLKMPERVEQVLGRLQAGELQIKVDTELRGPLSRIRRRSGSDGGNTAAVPGFTWPIIFAVSLAGGIVLLDTSTHVVEAWLCLMLATFSAVRIWVTR